MPNFGGNKDLGKLGKEYLNDLLCKFGPFCLQHSKTFDILHAFLWVTIAVLSTLKQVRFFGPPCIWNLQNYTTHGCMCAGCLCGFGSGYHLPA